MSQSRIMDTLRYEWLPDELSVCRLAADERVPVWLPIRGFTTVTRTDEELSIVCASSAVPTGVRSEHGWTVLKVLGPLPFEAVGILRRLADPLAMAGIPIIAIGTFDTDYVLVKRGQEEAADEALAASGLLLVST